MPSLGPCVVPVGDSLVPSECTAMLRVVRTVGGAGGAAQSAQCVGDRVDARVDRVECLLKDEQTSLEQGGLGCQRHAGSGRIGMLLRVYG